MFLTIKKLKIASNRIPISIITGYLGSGKTTLINNLLTQPGMDKIALIINEFGQIGIDNQLIESSIENTLLLENGCICCSIRGDLIDTINDLFAKANNKQIPQFSRILIETTGLANPGAIIKTIKTEIEIHNTCELNNVITLVDGVQGSMQLVRHEEAIIQLAHADIALISKADLILTKDIEILTESALEINPTLQVKVIQQGQVDTNSLFHSTSTNSLILSDNKHVHPHSYTNEFSHGGVSTVSLIHDDPIDEKKLRNWLSMLYSLRPFSMLRMKGFIRLTKSDKPLLVQAVGNIISPIEWRDNWQGNKPQTQLILIFKGLSPDAVRSSFYSNVLN
jgi:G3E family GTPase